MSKTSNDWLKNFLDDAQTIDKYKTSGIYDIFGLTTKEQLPEQVIKLNSNENLFIPLDFLKDLLQQAINETDIRFYPTDKKLELEESLAKHLKITPDQLLLGNGSDPIIELLVNSFLKHEGNVLSIEPTFSIYQKCAQARGRNYSAIPLLKTFDLDVDRILSSVKNNSIKILFICSPNNPTANQFKDDDIKSLLEQFNGLIVIDEAYVDFANYSFIDQINRYENLVLLRTFSKAFGIAGLRLGYAITNTDIAMTIRDRYQMPYTTSKITLEMGLRLLERFSIIKKTIKNIKSERNRLIKRLNDINNVQSFDSQSNFILMRSLTLNSEKVYKKLLNRGIIVKNLGKILDLDNCLRVTVAPNILMDQFLRTLEEIIKS